MGSVLTGGDFGGQSQRLGDGVVHVMEGVLPAQQGEEGDAQRPHLQRVAVISAGVSGGVTHGAVMSMRDSHMKIEMESTVGGKFFFFFRILPYQCYIYLGI